MSAKRKMMAIKAKRAKNAPPVAKEEPMVVEEQSGDDDFEDSGDDDEGADDDFEDTGDGEAAVAMEEDNEDEDDDEEEEDDDDDEEEEGNDEEEEVDSGDWVAFCDEHKIERRLARGIVALQWKKPSLVQRAAIPVALEGRDVVIRARTGSGKTACYGVPVLQTVLEHRAKLRPEDNPGCLAIVLAPTRELVAQARKQLLSLAAYCRDVVTVAALMGEVASEDAATAETCCIVVATPGALRDAIEKSAESSSLSKLRETVLCYVVDEADLVLSFGYEEDLNLILARLGQSGPAARGKAQGYLLSATLNEEVLGLKRLALRRAATVRLRDEAGVFGGERDDESQLAQYYVGVKKNDKLLVVYVMLKLALLDGRGILFVNDVDACYKLKLFLDLFGIRTLVLNAELPLRSRLHAIESFNRGFYDLLVATDASVEAKSAGVANDADDDDDDEEDTRSKKQKKQKGDDADADAAASGRGNYGVSRGIDFQNVKWVLNVDLPFSPTSYTHRVGRTARAGARGTALSLVVVDDQKEISRLAEIQASQPPTKLVALSNGGACDVVASLGTQHSEDADEGAGAVVAQPCPLAFDAGACEPFRYRVSDVQRGVTRASIREARAAELRREMLNSAELASHFESNPEDLAVLKHDRAELHARRELVAQNVKHVPDYLIPMALRNVGAAPRGDFKRRKHRDSKTQRVNSKRQRSDNNNGPNMGDAPRNKQNDPLQSFDASAIGDAAPAPAPSTKPDVFHAGDPDLKNETTSLRAKWKKDHKKGEFGNRKNGRDKRVRGDQKAFARKKF